MGRDYTIAVREELDAKKIIELHVRKNLALSKIAEMYGVSRQRVHQLKKEYEKKHGKIDRRVFLNVLTLKNLLDQNWKATQIAEHFGMSPSKISRLIRKFQNEYESGASNIKVKRKKTEDIISKQELFALYNDKLMTDDEIAQKFNISLSSVNLLRNKYGIAAKRTKSLRKLPQTLTKTALERLLRTEKQNLADIAEKYNCSVSSLIELKKTYGLI